MLTEQERQFPYWFGVSDLKPDYGEEIWFSCGGDRKTFEELLAIALDYEGIYFHLLHLRFKSPQKRSAAFHALSSVGFLLGNSCAFRAGKYPQQLDSKY